MKRMNVFGLGVGYRLAALWQALYPYSSACIFSLKIVYTILCKTSFIQTFSFKAVEGRSDCKQKYQNSVNGT